MLGEMMRTEFERRRVELAFLALLFAALPAVYALPLALADELDAGKRLGTARQFASLLTLALAVAAVRWGMGSWATERRGRWVYALSLPVTRLRLFTLRYLAALAGLGAAGVALAGVAYASAAFLRLPPGFYVYPGHLVAWTAVLAWFLFTVGFLAAGGSAHPWRWIVVPVLAIIAWMVLPDTPFASASRWLTESQASPLLFVIESPDLVGY